MLGIGRVGVFGGFIGGQFFSSWVFACGSQFGIYKAVGAVLVPWGFQYRIIGVIDTLFPCIKFGFGKSPIRHFAFDEPSHRIVIHDRRYPCFRQFFEVFKLVCYRKIGFVLFYGIAFVVEYGSAVSNPAELFWDESGSVYFRDDIGVIRVDYHLFGRPWLRLYLFQHHLPKPVGIFKT